MKLLMLVLAASLLWLNSDCQAHAAIETQLSRITALIERHPEAQSLYMHRAALYQDHGRLKRAEADLRQAARLGDPVNSDFLLGKLYYARGDHQRALDRFANYLRRHPNHDLSLLFSARAARESERTSLAIGFFDAYFAGAANPHPGEYLSAARLRRMLWPHDVAPALDLLDQAMKRIGLVPQLQRFAIELEMQRQNFAGAISRWQTLEPVFGRSPHWLFEAAQIYHVMGEKKAARHVLSEIEGYMATIKPTPSNQRLIRKLQRLTATLETG